MYMYNNMIKNTFRKKLTYFLIHNEKFQTMPTSYESYTIIIFHNVFILMKNLYSKTEKRVTQILVSKKRTLFFPKILQKTITFCSTVPVQK